MSDSAALETALEPLCDAQDVAEAVKVDRATVYRWIRLGRLPEPLRIEGGLRWRVREMNEWLSQSHNLGAR
jgi:predicted DNA-binding transcriptional regulator AlpA